MSLDDLVRAFAGVGLPLAFPAGAPNLEPLDDIRPTDPAPVARPLHAEAPEAGLEIARLRWDLVPWFWKAPVKAKTFLATNARSETVAETAAFREAFRRRRCLVLADAWYEWSGEKGRKTKWRIAPAEDGPFAIAGIWDRASTADGPVESFAMLTMRPGPDLEGLHHRQVVALAPSDWPRWLDLTADVSDLLRPPAAGRFRAEAA